MQTQDPESAGSSVERSNEQWLLDLAADGAAQTSALQDLRDRLQRSI
jgi:hypothetical protein